MTVFIKLSALALTLCFLVERSDWRAVDTSSAWALSLIFILLLDAMTVGECKQWKDAPKGLASILSPQMLPFYLLLVVIFFIAPKPQTPVTIPRFPTQQIPGAIQPSVPVIPPLGAGSQGSVIRRAPTPGGPATSSPVAPPSVTKGSATAPVPPRASSPPPPLPSAVPTPPRTSTPSPSPFQAPTPKAP